MGRVHDNNFPRAINRRILVVCLMQRQNTLVRGHARGNRRVFYCSPGKVCVAFSQTGADYGKK